MTSPTYSLGERAMLVSLSISAWSARRHDQKATDEVAANHHSDKSMGSYRKQLIPADALKHVRMSATALRLHHNEHTLAWGDDGTRILPAANFDAYQSSQQPLIDDFERATKAFLALYPTYVNQARVLLNGLFDERDYPSVDELRSKFGVKRNFAPVAQPNDFRVQLGDDRVAQIRAEIETRTGEMLAQANRDLWSRVQAVTAKLIERLTAYQVEPDGSVSHPFRDSLIENVRDMLDVMPRLNFTGDANLERVRQEMEAKLTRHSPEALRHSPELRAEVVASANTILSQMEGYCA